MLPYSVTSNNSRNFKSKAGTKQYHEYGLSNWGATSNDHSFVNDWMRAVRTPTAYRVGSAVHLNFRHLAKFGFIMLLLFAFAALLLPTSDYNPKFSKRMALHPPYNSTYPLSKPEKTPFGTRFRIGVITDLDTESKHKDKKNTWISYFLKGHLTLSEDHQSVTIEWDPEFVTLESTVSAKGRGMELSELVAFNGKLYTCDDRTGIVSEITHDYQVLPWALLNDGDGRQSKGNPAWTGFPLFSAFKAAL